MDMQNIVVLQSTYLLKRQFPLKSKVCEYGPNLRGNFQNIREAVAILPCGRTN